MRILDFVRDKIVISEKGKATVADVFEAVRAIRNATQSNEHTDMVAALKKEDSDVIGRIILVKVQEGLDRKVNTRVANLNIGITDKDLE